MSGALRLRRVSQPGDDEPADADENASVQLVEIGSGGLNLR
jgi:hypothetical protein